MLKKFRPSFYFLLVCVLLLASCSWSTPGHERQDAAPVITETRDIYEDANADAASETADTSSNDTRQQASASYVLNTNTMRFHLPSCRDVPKIATHNYATSDQPRSEIISRGYPPWTPPPPCPLRSGGFAPDCGFDAGGAEPMPGRLLLVYDKKLSRGFISQMLRNPIYAQADLELYEFFNAS